MKNDEDLVIFYHIQQGIYCVLDAIDETGQFDFSMLKKYIEDDENGLSSEASLGRFLDVEQMTKICFQVCQDIDASRLILLSVDDYNEAIKNASDLSELKKNLKSYGNSLVNIDRKRGFFKRIFS